MGKAVIYATGLTKTTQPLAKYIAKELGADLFNLKDLMRLDLSGYETIVFGTAGHGTTADKLITQFIEENRDTLTQKKLHLFVLTKNVGEKAEQEANAIADSLGLPEVVFFNKKAEEVNECGFPVEVDEFISKL